jgi:hypothetical protein
MNKIQSYKTSLFHAQNIPARWKWLWEKFVCCFVDKTINFEDIPVSPVPGGSFAGKHFSRILDYLFVFGEYGIWYVDYSDGTVKPTSKTTGEFTFAAALFDRIWFGGDSNTGLWYSFLSDPYTIIQSNITAGAFTAVGSMGAGYFGNDSPVFLFSNGGYWFDTNDSLLKPHTVITGDFKYTTNGYFYRGTGSNSGLWYRTQRISTENVTGSTVSGGSEIVFFTMNRIIFVVRDSTTVSNGASIVACRGALSRAYILYLATTTGLLDRYGNMVDSSRGYVWIEIGKDGDLYLCGNNGSIYYWDDYKKQIVDTGKTGSYSESCVGADQKMYFAGGNIVRLVSNNSGNTGHAVSMELNRRRIKYGKDEIVESYSMLDSVQPSITVDELKRLPQEDITLRSLTIWNNVLAKTSQEEKIDNIAYEENPTMCEIGEKGFVSKVLMSQLLSFREGTIPPGSAWRYNPLGDSIGQIAHTWSGNKGLFIMVWYIDNISFWASGNNRIQLQGTMYYSNVWQDVTIGFIECPPEEWIISNPSPTYSTILERINAARHTVSYPASVKPPFDISGIYEGPTAKTLVVYSKNIPNNYWQTYKNTQLDNVRIVINDEILGFRLLTLFMATWDNWIKGGANIELTKTLVMTTVISNIMDTYSILDAFEDYPAITENDCKQMLEPEISARARALLNYASVGEKYIESNSFIRFL